MVSKMSCFIALILASLPSLALNAADSSAKDVSFLPLTISISCNENTSPGDEIQYLRASGARLEVRQKECIDKAKTIDKVYPIAAAVEYSESFHLWLVAILLKDNDALAARKLSTQNVGKIMVISVDHRALEISQLGAPLRGNKVYMNADSESDAHHLMMLLAKH